ncbi:MAG: hypothetical protein IT349_01745 [Candidatus Eisenbacteria bacterium]|nr:hypothetical protein [Candidatus Eisenbacteria bacterium]MCC7140800.1 hypothetical protein [Candidatus Eisenbacteria bacterium]
MKRSNMIGLGDGILRNVVLGTVVSVGLLWGPGCSGQAGADQAGGAGPRPAPSAEGATPSQAGVVGVTAAASAAVPSTSVAQVPQKGTPGGSANEAEEPAPSAGNAAKGETTLAPPAHQPRSEQKTALAGMPGYRAPEDPEAEAVANGRRSVPPSEVDLIGGASSDRELAEAILEALNAADTSALHALWVTPREYQELMWPEFPESRPVTGWTGAQAWELFARKNEAAIRRSEEFQGRGLSLREIRYSLGSMAYTNFTVHQGVEFLTVDPSGQLVVVPLVRTFVERNGQFKVYAWKD